MPPSSDVSAGEPRYWIVKFAPFRTSWGEIVRRGTFTLRGVRSAEARRNLSRMAVGDLVFFYHSQKEQAIVGLMAVARSAYPDPTSSDPHWLTCDFTPVRTLARAVPLSELRADVRLSQISLVRQPRLAVSSIDRGVFNAILQRAGEPSTGFRQ